MKYNNLMFWHYGSRLTPALKKPSFIGVSYTEDERDLAYTPVSFPHSEIALITHGRGIMEVFKKSFNIAKGDLFIIKPNVLHALKYSEKNPLSYYTMGFEGTLSLPQAKPGVEARGLEISDDIFKIPINTNMFDRLCSMFESMRFELDARKINYLYAVESYFQLILATVLRCCGVNMAIDVSSNPSLSAITQSAKNFIDSNYYDSFKTEELAEKLSVSYITLHRNFKKEIGLSLISYRLEKQLAMAVDLLNNSDLNISRVCAHIGFSSPAHFSKLFKEKFGQTPKSFRKTAKAKPKQT